MNDLKTVEGKVKAVLQKSEDAGNDDMVLYLALYNLYLKNTGTIPPAEIMTRHKEFGLPSFENVGKTRHRLRGKCPELLGSARVRRLRAAGEKAHREYTEES